MSGSAEDGGSGLDGIKEEEEVYFFRRRGGELGGFSCSQGALSLRDQKGDEEGVKCWFYAGAKG